jgi:peptidoglycan hydrolase-like protein with peptidoglycan-binding domain
VNLRTVLSVLFTALAALVFAGSATAESTLSLGSRGASVRWLNDRLADLSYLRRGAVSGRFTDATFHAVVAFQKRSGIKPDGSAGRRTLRALEAARPPRPKTTGSGKRVEVSLAQQLAFLVSGDRVVRTIAVSTARPGYVTPRGEFRIYRKERMSWSAPYSVWLPYASYFTGGIAFHAYPDVPAYPASHGCIRVPIPFAPEFYAFASYGTPVIVR